MIGQGVMSKLKEGNLDSRKEFFTMRVVRPWSRWSREVLDAPSLAVFKVRLDKALNNLVKLELFFPLTGGVGTRESLGSIPAP